MLRIFGILIAAGLAWFGVSQSGLLDRRPVERVLFIGHSRTYANDLPEMVAAIADSAGAPVRYEVAMQAGPGATLKDHWQSEQTRELLTNGGWDQIIIQPNIVWRDDDEFSDFMSYGRRFVSEAGKHSKASVVVDWPMREAFYRKNGWNRSEHVAKTAAENWRLANESGAQLIDVAEVWQKIDTAELRFSLYTDNDHPSVQGTYLVALVIAANIANIDLAEVGYVPWGISGDDAALLRRQVQIALSGRSP